MCILELQDVQMTQVNLETMVSLPQMRSMKHPKMDRIGSLYDCIRLTQSLSTSLSKLKTIEWIDESGGYSHGSKIPFGSFRGFTQLEELTLYY